MIARRLLGLAPLVMVTAIAACSVEGPHLTGSELVLRVRDPRHVRGPAPLRWALVWPREDAESMRALLGPESGGGEITTSSVTVPLALPAPEVLAGAEPTFTVSTWGPFHRPRLLVYEDLDGDGRASAPEVDRWLAVDEDGSGLAYLTDVDGALVQIGALLHSYFYGATGDRYTPFVRASYRSTTVGSIVTRWSPELRVVLDTGGWAEASLTCPAPVLVGARSTSIILAEDLEPTLCGLEAARCTSVDLATLPAPATSTTPPELARLVECHTRAPLESLLVIEQRRLCGACTCTFLQDTTAWVTTATAAPPWWPCGQSIPTCESALGLTQPDTSCRAEE